jgi:cytochrome c-type biogenesis protein CcmH
MRRSFALATAAAAMAAVVSSGCTNTPVANTQSAVEERLTCQCGCGLTVHTCNHIDCSFGIPVKKDVAASLAAGQTGQEILDRYVKEYGEKILSAPTGEGFNLLAWYGPYAAILISALVIILALRRFRDRPIEAGPSARTDAPLSDEDRLRVERELDRME